MNRPIAFASMIDQAICPGCCAISRPLATLVASPRLAQPIAVGFESAGCQHAGARFDALVADERGLEAAIVEFEPVHRRFVANARAECCQAAVVRIDQCLASAEE